MTIEPPLRIIDIGNGCEAFSSTIYIPAKSELTTTMQSLTRSQFFVDYNFKYAKMSSFLVYHEMTFAQLTPEEVAKLQSKAQTLEPMNMKLFNQNLKLINENYLLTLPPWVILGGHVISGTFILTEITFIVWFCLKHRKSMSTLLKLGFTLARKIQKDPRIIEHLVQQVKGLMTTTTPPDPPLKPPSSSTRCTVSVSNPNTDEHTIDVTTTSKGISSPSLHSKAHRHTLELITEAAQELYAERQLHTKPCAGYLKETHKNMQTTKSKL